MYDRWRPSGDLPHVPHRNRADTRRQDRRSGALSLRKLPGSDAWSYRMENRAPEQRGSVLIVLLDGGYKSTQLADNSRALQLAANSRLLAAAAQAGNEKPADQDPCRYAPAAASAGSSEASSRARRTACNRRHCWNCCGSASQRGAARSGSPTASPTTRCGTTMTIYADW